MNEIILVTGQPRSGTTMMMRMLEAGGVPIYYDQSKPLHFVEDKTEYTNYNIILRETHEVKSKDGAWLAKCRGKAVKILTPTEKPIPKEFKYKFIYMDRNAKHMARSQRKYMDMASNARLPDRGLLSERIVDMRAKTLRMLRGYDGDIIQVKFESCLKNARAVAVRVAHFLGVELDIEKMIKVVVPRPASCLSYMMEEQIYA